MNPITGIVLSGYGMEDDLESTAAAGFQIGRQEQGGHAVAGPVRRRVQRQARRRERDLVLRLDDRDVGVGAGAELVEIEYEDLPVVIDPEEALLSGAAQLHESVPGNMPFEYEAGDKAAVATW